MTSGPYAELVLDLRRLRLLHELNRRGTIASVGEALHLSPSGVSQQLALLESEAGVRLLDRVGRGVRLTDAARTLVDHTEAVLARLERAETDLAVLGGQPRGRMRIASFQTATLALVPGLLDLLGRYEDLRIELAEIEPEEALPALLAHDYDLVLGEEYPGAPAPISPQMDREDLCRDPIRLAAPSPHPTEPAPPAQPAQRGEPAGWDVLERFSRCAWVMEPHGTASRRWATTMCRSAGFEPDVRYESDDLLAHLALVERGHAAAFLPDLIWHGRTPAVPLYRLAGQERTIFTGVRRGSEHHPAVRVVRDTLREIVASGPPTSMPSGSPSVAPCHPRP